MNMEFDYIIVGGGSAGAIMARRLADANVGTVVLIEAGKSDEGDETLLDITRVYDQSPEMDWGFAASRFPQGPADLNYSRAKVLGGCGSHNDCAYIEPPPSDFEEWIRLGAEGWGPQDTQRYFRKLREVISVEKRPASHPLSAAFLNAGRELGLEVVDFATHPGAGIGMLSLNAKGRLRQSSSVAYLHPLKQAPRNLCIMTETFVSRIIFRGINTVGCETDRGNIIARREVIVTAGAIQTPQLLMTSGIGDAGHLTEFGITPVINLPGVGQNLMDHFSSSVIFKTREPIPPWDVSPYEAIMMLNISGRQATPDVLCHFGLSVGSPDGRHGADSAKSQYRTDLVDIAPNIARPKSRGQVRIKAQDPRVSPVIDLGYFTDRDGSDMALMLSALKFCRQFGETNSFRSVIKREKSPGVGLGSDDELILHILNTCETVYHACGTCKMGDRADPLSVVTPDLRVKGVRGLRVCDASIIPSIPSVNINSTVMMIGERGADLIAHDVS
ncbi:MAG: GMC family oxidoreductase N-terminal domain-containing protein [Roseomonas sp.]|nr:GMC family oxidoreductase N-terminal domain-containing protein [Roseomonas sp.]